jgi:hypothetical protein
VDGLDVDGVAELVEGGLCLGVERGLVAGECDAAFPGPVG